MATMPRKVTKIFSTLQENACFFIAKVHENAYFYIFNVHNNAIITHFFAQSEYEAGGFAKPPAKRRLINLSVTFRLGYLSSCP